jgi:hypothetical protein
MAKAKVALSTDGWPTWEHYERRTRDGGSMGRQNEPAVGSSSIARDQAGRKEEADINVLAEISVGLRLHLQGNGQISDCSLF